MSYILSVKNLSKTYPSGFKALTNVNLDIKEGEVFALLGPNGAGKTTLISTICGVAILNKGKIIVNSYNTTQYPIKTKEFIGIVPQELSVEPFETVLRTVNFTRGLYGKPKDQNYVQDILTQLSLWDKRNTKIIELSGGMKRRVLIAKALSHRPKILFLDEPTAGVDVDLRKDMWKIINKLKKNGVTIILTTHYIEEAEKIADRIGIINKGKILLVEEKHSLIKRMGHKTLFIKLKNKLSLIPKSLKQYNLRLDNSKYLLIYDYDIKSKKPAISDLIFNLNKEKVIFEDVYSKESSLEDIFIKLLKKNS
tara:strand:+ start:3049 stop:3975 length:927 start_codon:yes stop_codon:yes gene_type:complete